MIYSTLGQVFNCPPIAALALRYFTISLLAGGAMLAQAETSDTAVREALATQEGDQNNTEALEQTLTATDKKYSMLRSRGIMATYNLSYSYIGEQLIDANFEESQLTNFKIQNTQGHTLTNTFSVDYGLLNNLTTNLTVPIVSKYSDTDDIDGDAHAFGDVSVSARYQPFSASRGWPSMTLSATAVLPTGRSPFETVPRELATGSGHGAFTMGVNASKVIDPVAIFGSFNFTYNLPEDGIDLVQDGNLLTEVAAGNGVGWGVGFAYALSYDITTTMSFQQQFLSATELTFITGAGDESVFETGNQTSAMFNVGLGVRVSSLTTLNFSVGIGLTPDSPDFSLSLNAPINF